ncbi:MAG: DUF2490 domain-containing protein [Flavobacterium sp.]|nr:DUF2490 domain-containing protein [Flavobacterium sp.]
MSKQIFIGLLIFYSSFNFAQESKVINKQQIIWYTYIFNSSLSTKWSVVTDIQERHFVNPTAQHLWAIRSNFKRDLGNQWDFGIGGMLFCQRSNTPEASTLPTIPELRPHFEFNNKQKLWKGTLSHRYRFESRFFQNLHENKLASGFAFRNFRFRYLVGYTLSLVNKNESNDVVLSVKLQDEIMLNFGNKIVTNVFDQNRIYIGFNYSMSKRIALEMGYLNIFQQQSKVGNFYDRI